MNALRRVCLIAQVSVLAGCTTPAPIIQRADVAVPVSCITSTSTIPARPAIKTNEDLRAMDAGRFVVEIAAERLDLISYSGELEAVISACK